MSFVLYSFLLSTVYEIILKYLEIRKLAEIKVILYQVARFYDPLCILSRLQFTSYLQ